MWQQFLQPASTEPGFFSHGSREVFLGGRWVRLAGARPQETGWAGFRVQRGREAHWVPDWAGEIPELPAGPEGYLVGDRVVSDAAPLQDQRVLLVEPGLPLFTRVQTDRVPSGALTYRGQAFPLGPEDQARGWFLDRHAWETSIRGATPALWRAFHWEWELREARERQQVEARLRAEQAAREQQQAQQRQAALALIGTAEGRRQLAVFDFQRAAEAALAVSGAQLVAVREGIVSTERVVQYRYMGQRLECVCHATTLQILDAGICLRQGGIQGDRWFTLESLPSVVAEALDTDALVVYRRW